MNLNDKTASGLMKNFYGYVVLVLCLSVITLFGLYYNLNQYIIHTLADNGEKMQKALDRSSDVLETIKYFHK